MPRLLKRALLFATGTIGFAAAVVQLIPLVLAPPDDTEIVLVSSAEEPYILDQDAANRLVGPVVAGKVRIDEIVETDTPVYVLTNLLQFGERGVLNAPAIAIFATRVVGGELDVSGAKGPDGTTPESSRGSSGDHGDSGLPGGWIFLAAARVEGTRIEASGGAGGRGEDGRDGASGRDGECDGFGGYVGARNGGAGGRGGNGGAGGDGGEVAIFVPANGSNYVLPNISAGSPGESGRGGQGGRGGTGCAGLGGIQDGHPDGPPGDDGDPGADGEDGAVVLFQSVSFARVKAALDAVGEALRDSAFARIETLEGVRRRLLAQPEGDDE